MKYKIMVAIGNRDFQSYGETNEPTTHTRRQVEENTFNCREVIFINKETGEVI